MNKSGRNQATGSRSATGGGGAHKTSVHGEADSGKGAHFTSPEELLTISEDHKAQLRQAFDIFDSTGVGRIPAQDVKVALFALGYDVDQSELQQLLRGAHVSGGVGDTVDFNDFYNVLVLKMTRKETRQECVRAFKQIDEEDKGGISLTDLRQIADSLNLQLTDDELAEMMLFAYQGNGLGVPGDLDGRDSFRVSEEDFLRLMKRANAY